jgi:hypothetical protein
MQESTRMKISTDKSEIRMSKIYININLETDYFNWGPLPISILPW